MKRFNKHETAWIEDRAKDRVSEIFDALNIEYRERIDYIQCACPIHQGDNQRALYWAFNLGRFRCTTRGCHNDPITGPSSSVYGLVRGAMSTKTGKEWSFQQAVFFVAKVLGLQNTEMDEETEEEIEIGKLVRQHRKKQRMKTKQSDKLLSDVVGHLKPDNVYYPTRGIKPSTIARYHISWCDNPNKLFYDRAFFPILDETGKVVMGWSARSRWTKCRSCSLYHNPETKCPKPDRKYAKWLHSPGFQSGHCLYNSWFAKHSIGKTGVAIVCESPGNCWAYEQAGIPNSVGTFGAEFKDYQKKLLQRMGAINLIFVLDNDEAGQKARKTIEKQLEYYFRLIFYTPENVNDVAELLPQEIKDRFVPLLNKNSREGILK